MNTNEFYTVHHPILLRELNRCIAFLGWKDSFIREEGDLIHVGSVVISREILKFEGILASKKYPGWLVAYSDPFQERDLDVGEVTTLIYTGSDIGQVIAESVKAAFARTINFWTTNQMVTS